MMITQFKELFLKAYVYKTLVIIKNAFFSSFFPNSGLIVIHLICTEIISYTSYGTAFHFSYSGLPHPFFFKEFL